MVPSPSAVSVAKGLEAAGSSVSWATLVQTVINSATDSKGVHRTLQDLLPVRLSSGEPRDAERRWL